MCWFEESVVAEVPRSLPMNPVKIPAAAVPLPLSPPLVPMVEKELGTEPFREEVDDADIPQEVPSTIQEETQMDDTDEETTSDSPTNLEKYSIETGDGKNLDLTTYVNSSGVRMIEICGESGIQMRLSDLQYHVTAMVESAACVDEMEELENKRQQEFITFAGASFSACIVLLILITVSVSIMLVNQETSGY